MPHTTLRIIREEHAALTAMLRSVLLLLGQHHRNGTRPDFAVLRAMLFYVEEFSEQCHHRKESKLLFPKLRARAPLSRQLLDRLDEDHARAEHKVRELQHQLTAFEILGDIRRAGFERAARRYADFYLKHMALEEREILPLAERVLTEQDLSDLDEAFGESRDPIEAHEPPPDYRELFSRIIGLVPATVPLASVGAPRPHSHMNFEDPSIGL